jgi:hypothetical protein
MNTPPSLTPTSLLSELLSMQPAELTAWLDEARVRRAMPAGFNWRGLAFAAAAEARRAGAAGASAEAIAAGRIAVTASEMLGDESAQGAAMAVRAGLIQHLGALAGDPLRDPTIVHDWCRAAIGALTPDEAVLRSGRARDALAKLASAPESADAVATEIRPLRSIKNRLAILAGLGDLPADLTAWLAVRDRLP